jgi:hypothetical protein
VNAQAADTSLGPFNAAVTGGRGLMATVNTTEGFTAALVPLA